MAKHTNAYPPRVKYNINHVFSFRTNIKFYGKCKSVIFYGFYNLYTNKPNSKNLN